MAAQKSKKQTHISKKPSRQLAKPAYKTFRLHKRLKHDGKPLPKARLMFVAALRHLNKYKRVFFKILLLQLTLTLLFVAGVDLLTSDFTETKTLVNDIFGTDSTLFSSVALLGVLVVSSGTGASDVAGLYGLLLAIIFGLAIIWALRKTHAGAQIKMREAFYQGMYPLIPFLLVLLVILLQLLPLIIGNGLYNIVIAGGIAVTGLEKAIWLLLFITLGLLSLYMLASSLFALFIVTLPDIAPLQALKSARQLVLHRRLTVARKLLFLPLVLLVLLAILLLPVITFVPSIAEVSFFVVSNILMIISLAYLYEMYRKLL